jgi:hypothetical protein
MSYPLSSPIDIYDAAPVQMTLTNTSGTKVWRVSTDVAENLILGTASVDVVKIEPDSISEPSGALGTTKVRYTQGGNAVSVYSDPILAASYDVVYPPGAPSAGQVMMITGPTSSQFLNINPLDVAHGGTGSSTPLNNNRIMVSSGGVITESSALTNGQLLIGSTGAAPVPAAITAGSGISIGNGAGSITIGNTGVLSIRADAGLAEIGALTFVSGTNVSIVDSPARTFTFNVPTGAGGVTTWAGGSTGLTPAGATSGAVTLSGTLVASNGGTGQSSYTIGDLLYASGSTALSKLADIATGNALISGGVSTAPSWGKIGLTTHISGILPVANGGTNSSAALNNSRIMVSSGGAIVEAAALTNGQLLIGSTGAAPVAATLTAGSNITVTNGAGSISIATTVRFTLTPSFMTTSTSVSNQQTLISNTFSIPANYITAGTTFRIDMSGTATVTSAGSTNSIQVYFGANGTPSDPNVYTYSVSSANGTSVPFMGYFIITCRSNVQAMGSGIMSTQGSGLMAATTWPIVGGTVAITNSSTRLLTVWATATTSLNSMTFTQVTISQV